MSVEARLETLNERHKELEAALHEETMHPAFSESKLVDLKRKKLAIKDEMEALKAQLPN